MKFIPAFVLIYSVCFVPFLTEAEPIPDADTLDREGAIINKIIFERIDVFDPRVRGENNKLFRSINVLHLETHEKVIRRELLFKEGDRYRKSSIEESARKLRALPFLYTAQIDPVGYHDGRVDMRVLTQDSWTTKIGLNIGRKGGVNTYKVGIEDKNFLGFGKELSAEQFKKVENSGSLFTYIDRQLFGTRWNLVATYENNSDGRIETLYGARPFYSLDSRWACALNLYRGDQIKRLYHQERVSNIFRQKEDLVEMSYGFSEGLEKNIAQRYYFFYSYEDDRFHEADLPVSIMPSIPEDRTISAIGLSYQRIDNSFIKVRRFASFKRIEDFKIGNEFFASMGFSLPALGATRSGILLDVSDSRGFQISACGKLFLAAGYHARLEGNSLRNAILSFSQKYFNTRFKNQTIFVGLSGDIGQNLDAENQFLLGGDTGLRGYPARFLDGSRWFLVSIEDRIFTDLELFHLFNIGFAAFFDSGLAWNHREELKASAFRKDAGLGLRIGNRRSSLVSVLHIDLAFPLDPVNGKSGPEIVVMSEESY